MLGPRWSGWIVGRPDKHARAKNALNNCPSPKALTVGAEQEIEVWALWGSRAELPPWAEVRRGPRQGTVLRPADHFPRQHPGRWWAKPPDGGVAGRRHHQPHPGLPGIGRTPDEDSRNGWTVRNVTALQSYARASLPLGWNGSQDEPHRVHAAEGAVQRRSGRRGPRLLEPSKGHGPAARPARGQRCGSRRS